MRYKNKDHLISEVKELILFFKFSDGDSYRELSESILLLIIDAEIEFL